MGPVARTSPAGALAPLWSALLLLAGCASVDPSVCGRFEQTRQGARYDTVYRFSEQDTRRAADHFKPQLPHKPAAVRWYTLRANTTEVRPCEHLYLYKELYLHRQAGEAVTLEEVREFYTASGRKVATKKENVSAQLADTGYYYAAVPLPIPEAAPAGTYRVVSRLTARRNGGREAVLATASTDFRVVRR